MKWYCAICGSFIGDGDFYYEVENHFNVICDYCHNHSRLNKRQVTEQEECN